MKTCKRCCTIKELDEFGDNKNMPDKKSNYCKNCERVRGVEYREKNRNKVNQSSKKWRQSNPEKYEKTIKSYLEKNPHMKSSERIKKYRQNSEFRKKQSDRRKEYYLNNIDKERKLRKEYYNKNKEISRKKNNEWKSEKRKKDGFYRMKLNLRNRIREYLIGESKGKRTKEIIGLDKTEFKIYIEKKFTEGMSWENYGKWHLDHIIPLCNALNREDALKLNHYTNLQPLWAEDNIRKNRKL